jgi:putative transposase
MVAYRRVFVPGGTYFFTVTLMDHSSTLLIDRIDELHEAFHPNVTRVSQKTLNPGYLLLADTGCPDPPFSKFKVVVFTKNIYG